MDAPELDSATTSKPILFKQYGYRWVIVTIYSLLSILIGLATVPLFPIATILVSTYEIPSVVINSVALIYFLLFTLIGFPANYFIDTHGLRTGLIIGTGAFSIGACLQMFINYSFWTVVAGSVAIGVAQPFILNCIGKVATYWFFKEHRTMVCSVITLLNLVGTGIGFVIPTMFVSEDLSVEEAKLQIFHVMLVEGIPAIVLTLVVIIFMKDKPQTPPSLGGEVDKMPFKDSIWALLKNRNFRLIFFGFTLYYGPLATLSSMLNFLLKPFSFTDLEISILGMLVIACGALGAIVFSLYVSRTQKYSCCLKSSTIIAFFLFSLALLGLWLGFPFWTFTIIFAVLGMMVTPVYSLSYDLACETAFPVGEAQVIGVLNSGGNISAIVLILVVQFGVDFGTQEKSYIAFIIMLAVIFVATVCYFLVRDILVRIDAEKASTEQKKSIEMQIKGSDEASDAAIVSTNK